MIDDRSPGRAPGRPDHMDDTHAPHTTRTSDVRDDINPQSTRQLGVYDDSDPSHNPPANGESEVGAATTPGARATGTLLG